MNERVLDLIKKGNELIKTENYDDALSYFEQALILEPNNAELWNRKGVALRSLGRYDEALECFNKSLSIEPRDNKAS
ncbi:MAG: tetratricopeptide repeat protein [Nitrososphaera sp.]|jgi:Flp pilus assembly protein TadD